MFVELQMSAGKLGRIVRNYIRQLDLCIASTFNFLGSELMVDGVSVLNTTSLERQPASFTIVASGGNHTIHGYKAVLKQPLRINLVKIDDLIQNDRNPTTPTLSPEVSVLLSITAMAEGGDAKFKIAFNSVDFGAFGNLLDGSTKQKITAFVSSAVPPIVHKLDLSSLKSMVPGVNLTVTNVGVTETNGVLILRIEINGASNAVADWTEFFNTYDRNFLGGRDWAVLVDKDLIVPGIRKKVEDNVPNPAKGIGLSSGVDVYWDPAAGPVFQIAFRAVKIGACSCVFVHQDAYADVNVAVTLQVPSTDVFREHIHVTGVQFDMRNICCRVDEIVASVFWPIVGAIFLAEGKTDFGTYMKGLIPVAGVQYALGALFPSVALSVKKCQNVDDKTVNCDQAVSFDFGVLGVTFRLLAVSAQQEGPALSGSIEAIADLPEPKLAITSVEPLHWNAVGSCSRGFYIGLSGNIVYEDSVPGTDLKVCEVSVMDDPVNFFFVASKDDPVTVTASQVQSVRDAYFANPYPCRVSIVSNGGVRIVDLGQPPLLLPQYEQELEKKVKILDRICSTPFGVPRRYPWRWPYPDPRKLIEIGQIWQVITAKLTPTESVDLLDPEGRVLASAVGNTQGAAYASYWGAGSSVLPEIGVRITGPTPSGDEAATRRVSMKQTELVLRSRIAINGAFIGLAVDQVDGRPRVSIQTREGTTVYDLTVATCPALLESVTRSEQEGRGRQTRDPLAMAVGIAALGKALFQPEGELGGRLVIVADGEGMMEIGRYFHTPWFANAQERGGLFARLGPDGTHVSIYEVKRSVDI